jgi:hypothetical protein
MHIKKITTLVFIMIAFAAKAQHKFPIDENGSRLKDFYLSLNVENLWIAGHHINWQTGEQDNPNAEHGIHTHCSAFVAAACKKINIYILRPPEHGQLLLANAQFDWLPTQEAKDDGWKLITERNVYAAAQRFANSGYVVIAIYKNPNPKIPGHVALVMPDELSGQKLEESGPALIMAGTHNHNHVSLKAGFKSHISSWPETEILFYYNSNLPAIK